MMRVYRLDAILKFMFFVSDTWMCLKRGEGEKEIANHGWSGVISFSQETGALGQQRSRSDRYEPKLYSKSQVQDAHDSPTQLPFFSFFSSVVRAAILLNSRVLATLLLGQSSLVGVARNVRRSVARCYSFVLRNSILLWNSRRVARTLLFNKIAEALPLFEKEKGELSFDGAVVAYAAGGAYG